MQACPRSKFRQTKFAEFAKNLLRGKLVWLSAIFMTPRQMEQAVASSGQPLRGVKRTHYTGYDGAKVVPLFKVPYQGQYIRPKVDHGKAVR